MKTITTIIAQLEHLLDELKCIAPTGRKLIYTDDDVNDYDVREGFDAIDKRIERFRSSVVTLTSAFESLRKEAKAQEGEITLLIARVQTLERKALK